MAMFVKVRFVSPRGSARVFVDGEHVEVESGGTIDVTPETAGRAPGWRPATDEDRGAVDNFLVHTRGGGSLEDPLEVFDLGAGLLAQTENWRLDDAPDDAPSPADEKENV